MDKDGAAELVRAFVGVFESMASVRGRLRASGKQDAVVLLDNAAAGVRKAMALSARCDVDR